MNRYLRVVAYALLIMSLGGGITGCSKENQRQNPPQEQDEDVGIVGEDTEVPPPKDVGSDPIPDPDVADLPDAEPDAETDIVETAEAPQPGHQLCAVAGRSSNSDVIALHCLGTHDASGFQAKNDQGIWQPGTLQIIAK